MDIQYLFPNLYQRSALATTTGRNTLVLPSNLIIGLGSATVIKQVATSIALNTAENWDSAYQSYATPATRAGKDVCVYVVSGGNFLLSPLTTNPTGYNNTTSRKIGGFHCLCLDAGTIAFHSLTGYLTGDIIPYSMWDLNFKPSCPSPSGMVYSAYAGLWVDIYLQSGTGTSTASAFNGTITDTRIWNDHVDDFAAVGKRMLSDAEFQAIAEGSNQKTNILGSADPVTTGAHVDTASRRMISNIGCEDCCGVTYQWLLDTQFKIGGLVDPTVDPAFSWYAIPGNKGSLYRQGTTGDAKLLAGGFWSAGSYCGSRSRYADGVRWFANSSIGSRGCAIGINK